MIKSVGKINHMSTRDEMKARIEELLPRKFWQAFGHRLAHTAMRSQRRPVDMARHLNCSPAHISKLVKTGSVSLPAATALAMYLNVSLDELLFGNQSRLPAADDPEFLRQLQDWMRAAPSPVREMAAKYNVPKPRPRKPE